MANKAKEEADNNVVDAGTLLSCRRGNSLTKDLSKARVFFHLDRLSWDLIHCLPAAIFLSIGSVSKREPRSNPFSVLRYRAAQLAKPHCLKITFTSVNHLIENVYKLNLSNRPPVT